MEKRIIRYKFVVILVLSIFAQMDVFSQSPPALNPPNLNPPLISQDSTSVETDSISLPYNFNNSQSGNLILNNPSEIEVTYDADIDMYIVREKVGGYFVSEPVYMTPSEYQEYSLKKDIQAHYKEKLKAVAGNTAGSADAQKNLLPTYYIKSGLFESIFGGNTIEVNPQGNVQVQLGVLSQTIENPQISERNRKSFTFDFDQQISASINAKVGTRLKVTAAYDTQSTFDFQNLVKLEFNPDTAFSEDDILQKIEVGNVSMPIKNSLVTGAQSLFGLKTKLQFGKTTVTSVFAEQKSQTRTVAAQGGSTINEFEMRATDYDADRHFFLAQAFRDNYDTALENFPLINSQINITKVEVWITNRQASTEDFRNIVGIADLGERDDDFINGTGVISQATPTVGVQDPINGANNLGDPFNPNLTAIPNGVREIATVSASLSTFGFSQGTDYSVLENARRLQPSEYTIHPLLGFISLNRRLGESDVLAVAYEYTVTGNSGVFKVGELTSDGIVAPENLVVKLLRSEIINTSVPLWDLMMKNIYSLGAFQMSSEGFRFELLYRDDATGVPTNIFQNSQTAGIPDKTLLNIFSLDNLDQNQFSLPEGDGYFDYVEGITIDSQKGLVIFPTVQPFGESLQPILTAPADAVYIFDELYSNTQSQARNNFQNKDKYFLKGYYKSESANGIPLGAFNVPQGSVTVTSGGRVLLEGVDYVVDYQIGRVQIINPALEASNAPIEVSVENNSVFNLQAKRFIGIDVEHKFSDKLYAGFTFLNLRERPLTQKTLFNAEPINNTIFGLNADYATKVPKFTKWVNYLPNIDTDVESNFSVRGDFAYLIPGSPKQVELEGEATTYLDDFEGAQIPLELKTPLQWYLSSTPQGQDGTLGFNGDATDLTYGYKRGKLAWYIVDQLFYGSSSLQPGNIDDVELSRAEVRRIRFNELFPETDIDITQSSVLRSLDLAYYPSERGSYNNDPDFADTPEENWGGITRPLTVTNFEQANIEYIQFWMLDPYPNYSISQAEGLPAGVDPQNPTNQVGDLYFNLGNISEDVLKDGRKMYENGLPETGGNNNTDPSIWGKVPTGQSLLYTFDIEDDSRLNQDIGLDGLNDTEENTIYSAFSAEEDPAADNYRYFRGSQYDADNASILSRYKAYNNTQGNSPTSNLSGESFPTSATTYPDVEDINKDQTMSTVESYYQYKVSMNASDLVVGQNNIVDQKIVSVNLDDGTQKDFRWMQFRIPINSPTDNIGNMSGFNSIRFMRMFMTGFKMPVVLRFGELQLIRGDWRRYVKEIDETNNANPTDLNATELENFQVGVVSVEENGSRSPIPYVIPPGIQRERLQGNTRVQFQNEQSLSVKVSQLASKETRAVYKNVSIDLRMYKKLKLFVHLEELDKTTLNDDDLQAIIRLGSDLNDNFYQIEFPLKVTADGSTSADDIWANNMNVILEHLGKLKLLRFEEAVPVLANEIYPAYGIPSPIEGLEGYEIRVKGSPNLGNIRTMMLGVKNNSDGIRSAELWFNELRTSEFDNQGGWAAVVSADANFADFADVSVTGRMETIGFGGIEQRVNERNLEDTKLYDVVTNVNVGKLLPQDWGIKLPLNYSISEETHDPKYDEQYQDVLFEDTNLDNSPNRKESQDYTKRKSISLINVRKDRTNTEKKKRFYDVENLSVSYAYNETQHKDYNVQKYLDQNVRASANYNYTFQPKSIEPFKNWGFLTKKKYLKFIKDFNINLLPSTISVNSNVIRSYNEQKSRSLVEGLPALPTLKQRNFMFDWDYNIGYNLTKSLQFNFRALNSHVYDDYAASDDITLFDNFFTIGRPDHYHQTLNGTYQIPIDKLPYLDFIKADYAYTADFDWQAASQSYVGLVGNAIQNANTHNLSVDFNFKKLYKSIGLTKVATKRRKKGKKKKVVPKRDADGKVIKPTTVAREPSKSLKGSKLGKGLVDALMMIKRARISYVDNNGIFLPGYAPEVGFLGRDNYSGGLAPSFGFVFGSQIDIRNRALENGWLVTRNINDPGGAVDDPYYSRTFAQTHFDKVDVSVDITPIRDLNIELQANKIYTKNTAQQLDVVNDLTLGETIIENNPISEIGNFSMSFNMIKTAFGENADETFQEFRANRAIIAQRLADDTGQPVSGYGPNSQQVMLPAFVAAYSGKSASSVKTSAFRNIPLPNWTLTYKGLMRNKWFKKTFQSFTVTHGYRSSYSINNFTNNLLYDETQPTLTDVSGNYFNEKLFSGVNVIEEFSPLVKVDLKMKNSMSLKAEIRKDRALNLNFNNNTLTEIRGKEYIVGLGYRIKDLKIRYRFDGKKQTLKGDLNLKADITLRDNETLIRDVDEDNEQITGGQRLFSLRFLADYALSRNLTASFYYDQNSSRYAISTSFPRSSFSTGLLIRYNIGN